MTVLFFKGSYLQNTNHFYILEYVRPLLRLVIFHKTHLRQFRQYFAMIIGSLHLSKR